MIHFIMILLCLTSIALLMQSLSRLMSKNLNNNPSLSFEERCDMFFRIGFSLICAIVVSMYISEGFDLSSDPNIIYERVAEQFKGDR